MGAPLIHVVDDNPEIRDSLQLLFKSVALDVSTYASAAEFLSNFSDTPDRPTCLLLDVRLPGMSGMALLDRLQRERPWLPIIIITGHGDIDMAVRAMKIGAVDFITKPIGAQSLLDRIQEVLRQSVESMPSESRTEDAVERWETLTPREREIFELIVSGASNKAIAFDLGISTRTVESHRARVMEKMNARTLVDLVLFSVRLKAARQGIRS